MLKINLLPIRQLKKRAKAKSILLGMLTLFLAAVVISVLVGWKQASTIQNLQTEISNLQNEKSSYAPTLAKIEKLKKDKEELSRKTNIIKLLRTESSLTVRIMDEVASRMDNQRMWLESLDQKGFSLKLKGIALDNQTIAQFMDKLKDSKYISEVTLDDASLKNIADKDLKSFGLNCDIAHEEIPTPTTGKKDKKVKK